MRIFAYNNRQQKACSYSCIILRDKLKIILDHCILIENFNSCRLLHFFTK